MKKTKMAVVITIILIFTLLIVTGNVEAHSVELDKDNLIGFPILMLGGEDKFTIDSSLTDYKLYY